MRAAWSVPASARLVSLTANPKVGGTFGREGLRIHAVFELGEAASAYRSVHRTAEWRPLPFPEEVLAINSGPEEVRGIANGVFLLDVAAWANAAAQPFAPYTPEELPVLITRYRIAVLDTATGRLHTLYKQFY